VRALASVLLTLPLLAACGGAGEGARPSAASVTATGAPSAAASKPATSILVGIPGVSMGNTQVMVATEANLFTQHGLAAEVRSVGNGTAVMAALISGQAQIIQVGGSDAVSAKVAGADVVVLTVPIQVYSYVLYVPESIRSPADIKGKKVGVDSYGSPPDIAIRVALRRESIDPDKDVSIVAVGDVPTRMAALISGAIQGTMLNPPFTLEAENKGFHPLIDLAALKLPYANAASMTLRSYIGSHRDVVQNYVDAFIEANNRVRHDKPFTMQVMSKFLKITDQRQLEVTYDYYVNSVYAAVPAPRPELFKDSIEQLATQNKAIAGFDANTIIDGSFVQSAVQRGLVQQ
jgi:NitT/TauT family transport system substrate-binding protein